MVEGERNKKVALQNHKTHLQRRKHGSHPFLIQKKTKPNTRPPSPSSSHTYTPQHLLLIPIKERNQLSNRHLLAHHRLGHRNRLAHIQAILALPPQHQRIDKLGASRRAADHPVARPAAAVAAEPLAGFGA